jgi:Flp pilus assembly protein TadG
MLLPSRSCLWKPSRRRGGAVVEFAVVAPLLLLLSMGMIEVTRAAQVKMTLADAVRHGCRVGIQPHMSNAEVAAAVHEVLQSSNIDVAKTAAAIYVKKDDKAAWAKTDVADAARGAWIKVSVTVSLTEVGWIAPLMFAGDAHQTEAMIMMHQ